MSQQRSKLIRSTFNGLRQDTLSLLDAFYDPSIVFEDPVGKIEGLKGMKKYYENMYKNVQEIRFDFVDEVVQGPAHVAVWEMHLKAKGLNGGEEVILLGNSLIKFDSGSGKVIYHRDYFDMGEMVYEHIPVLGTIIRAIRKRFEVE